MLASLYSFIFLGIYLKIAAVSVLESVWNLKLISNIYVWEQVQSMLRPFKCYVNLREQDKKQILTVRNLIYIRNFAKTSSMFNLCSHYVPKLHTSEQLKKI